MGNISSSDLLNENNDKKNEVKDIKSIQSLGFFNDSFITSIVDNLPVYGFDEEPESTPDAAAGTAGSALKEEIANISDHQSIRLKQLSKIFANDVKSGEKVEDHQSLSIQKHQSGFEIMRKRRARVLVQLFKVSKVVSFPLFSLTG
jgi:hypothetical protein